MLSRLSLFFFAAFAQSDCLLKRSPVRLAYLQEGSHLAVDGFQNRMQEVFQAFSPLASEKSNAYSFFSFHDNSCSQDVAFGTDLFGSMLEAGNVFVYSKADSQIMIGCLQSIVSTDAYWSPDSFNFLLVTAYGPQLDERNPNGIKNIIEEAQRNNIHILILIPEDYLETFLPVIQLSHQVGIVVRSFSEADYYVKLEEGVSFLCRELEGRYLRSAQVPRETKRAPQISRENIDAAKSAILEDVERRLVPGDAVPEVNESRNLEYDVALEIPKAKIDAVKSAILEEVERLERRLVPGDLPALQPREGGFSAPSSKRRRLTEVAYPSVPEPDVSGGFYWFA